MVCTGGSRTYKIRNKGCWVVKNLIPGDYHGLCECFRRYKKMHKI